MAVAYVDFNRGNDTTGNGSINNPYKTLSRVSNWTAGAGGGILLARDSVFEIAQTLTASNGCSLTSGFNGVQGNRAFIDAYDPPGVGSLTTKPTIRSRMLPTPADWLWDSTIQFGAPKGWYLQFTRNATHWDARVKVAGAYAGTMNQDTSGNNGGGYINGGQFGNHPGAFVNGMSLDTLRFNLDYAGANVGGSTNTRLYLSGFKLRTPGVGNDPSSIVGPGQIEVSFGTSISMYDAGNYTIVRNISVVEGAGLLLYQGTPDTVRVGLEVTDIDFFDVNSPFRINQGGGTAANNRWTMDIHNIKTRYTSGPVLYAYGAGITGTYRDSLMEDGNISSSMGGSCYMQIDTTTQGGNRDPFVVTRNVARRWKNGAGNNEFDGGCYYADVNDNGTMWIANEAYDSFVAFQCGSGKRSEWYSNKAINCEVFAMFNNPNTPSWRLNDYHFCNNHFEAAAKGTYPKGDVAAVHDFHVPFYHVGPPEDLVQLRFRNNLMINNPADPTRQALMIGTNQNWIDGKASADNNLFKGYGTSTIWDFGRVDKTASAIGTLSSSTNIGWVNSSVGNYRLAKGSGLVGRGIEFIRPKQMLDATGQQFQSPPSVGSHEIQLKPSAFWRYQ